MFEMSCLTVVKPASISVQGIVPATLFTRFLAFTNVNIFSHTDVNKSSLNSLLLSFKWGETFSSRIEQLCSSGGSSCASDAPETCLTSNPISSLKKQLTLFESVSPATKPAGSPSEPFCVFAFNNYSVKTQMYFQFMADAKANVIIKLKYEQKHQRKKKKILSKNEKQNLNLI